jgi:hypothetical protein
LANSIRRCPAGATEIDASSASSTVVKRSNEADSCSRMRLGSVMSVIDVIQPVCLPARIDQRRHIQAGIEQGVVGALDAHLNAAGPGGLPASSSLSICGQRLVVGVGPVGEGRGAADQLGLAPAGHLAERRR